MYGMVTKVLTSGTGSNDRKIGDMVNIRCNEIPVGDKYMRVDCHDPKNTNTVVVNYYQWKPGNLAEYGALLIGEHLIEEPVFDVLRTKEQLGYSVRAGILNTYGTLAFYVFVNSQATKFTTDFVHERMEAFLKWFVTDKLANLSDEEYDETVATLIKVQTAADVTLSEEFNRNWSEMKEREYAFDRKNRLVQILETTKKCDMVKMMSKLFSEDQRRKLSVQVVGNPDGIKIQEQDEEGGGAGAPSAETEIDPNGVYKQILWKESGTTMESLFITDAQKFKSNLTTFPVHLLTK